MQRHVTGAAALALFAKSRVLWRLVEVASFRVVVRWFSACSGVMPPREKWRRRVLYQRTQAAASRSTSPIAPGAGVAGALPVADEFCFVQGVQRLGQGVNPFKQKTDTQTIKHAPWLILHGCSAIAAPLTLSAHTWSSFARTPGIEGYSYPHDETIVFNVDFPASASRKVATKPTRFVDPSSWLPPTSIPTFPHQQAEKLRQNQHVLSFNPRTLTQLHRILTLTRSNPA